MNVSKGDLAYAVDGEGPAAEFNGTVFTVTEYCGLIKYERGQALPTWLCHTSVPVKSCGGKWRSPEQGIQIPDCCLRRIAGPSVDTTDIVERPVEEIA